MKTLNFKEVFIFLYLIVCIAFPVFGQAEYPSYIEEDQMLQLPGNQASLYLRPWKAFVQTVPATVFRDGVGIYYKHVPDFSLKEHTAIMKVLRQAGLRSARLAVHWQVAWLNDERTDLVPEHLKDIVYWRKRFKAARRAGLRPCITFVHFFYWKQKDGTFQLSPPLPKPDDPAFKDTVRDLTALADIMLREAIAAGFKTRDSFDFELHQGFWWGAPCYVHPLPYTFEDVRPGGRLYEAGKRLCTFVQKKYPQARIIWSYHHHLFDKTSVDEVPQGVDARAFSFYSHWSGLLLDQWMKTMQHGGVQDVWPPGQQPLVFREGQPPKIRLAMPEGWMANYTRHDCLLHLTNPSARESAASERGQKLDYMITSLGTSPDKLGIKDEATGWKIKQKALTRQLLFWLNKGSSMVLLLSAYERDPLTCTILPSKLAPLQLKLSDSPCLKTLLNLTSKFAKARPVREPTQLRFQAKALSCDKLLPGSEKHRALLPQDMLVLCPYQMRSKSLFARRDHFLIGAYVMTCDIAKDSKPFPFRIRIEGIDGKNAGITLYDPIIDTTSPVTILDRGKNWVKIEVTLTDYGRLIDIR